MLLISCNARISGKLDGESAGDFTASISLMPRISALIRSLQAFSGEEKPEIIDAGAISASMAAAGGISSVSFQNTSLGIIDGLVKISRINDFMTSENAVSFIRFEQTVGSSQGKCTINLRRELGPEILSHVSAEITAYLEALMAPIATGEELNKEEYLNLVESIYGGAIAGEINSSTIRVSVDFPGTVQSVLGGTFSGSRAEFNIPLVNLLVLERALVYEVIWK